MKVRSGFVSNSSSSSFVILGAKIDIDFSEEEMIKLMDKHGIKYDDEYPEDDFWGAMYNGKFGFSYFSEPDIIGKYIASGDECGLEESTTSFADLEKMAKEVKENVKKVLDIDIDVQLLTGERCC